MIALLVPLLFILLFVYALFKKVRLYDCFVDGIKQAIPLVLSLFPYLAAIFMLSALFEESGLSDKITSFLAPAFEFLGIPKEISRLVLLKPFSGSGCTAILSEIYKEHGADSYIARCASVCYGSSETVFYISAVYFAGTKRKNLWRPITISLAANFIGMIFGCFLCRFL